VAAHWSQKISGAASAASGTRCCVCATHASVRLPHAPGSQRLCALDVLVAACQAIRGGPSASPVAEPLLPETRAAAAGVTTWRSRKLKVVNSLPKSNRFGVIGEHQPRALAALRVIAFCSGSSSADAHRSPRCRPRYLLPAAQRNKQRRHGGAHEAHVRRRRDGSGQVDGVNGKNFAVRTDGPLIAHAFTLLLLRRLYAIV
jgi:hypothetical protein